jgi:uncharacterized protein (TIGR00369 family)
MSDINQKNKKAKFDRIFNRKKPPYYDPLGLEIVEVAESYAKVKMAYSKDIVNVYGMINGGVIATLADAAVANALLSKYDDEILTTIEFKMNFWRAAKTAVVGEARVLHKGRRVAVSEVEIKDTDGNALAKGLFTYAVRKRRHTDRDTQEARRLK